MLCICVEHKKTPNADNKRPQVKKKNKTKQIYTAFWTLRHCWFYFHRINSDLGVLLNLCAAQWVCQLPHMKETERDRKQGKVWGEAAVTKPFGFLSVTYFACHYLLPHTETAHGLLPVCLFTLTYSRRDFKPLCSHPSSSSNFFKSGSLGGKSQPWQSASEMDKKYPIL